MVGTTVIGDSVLNVNTLPPEARALGRYFRLLSQPLVMRDAFLDVFQRMPSSPEVEEIIKTFDSSFYRLREFEDRADRQFEQRLSLGVNASIHSLFPEDESKDDLDSLASPAAAAKKEDDKDDQQKPLEEKRKSVKDVDATSTVTTPSKKTSAKQTTAADSVAMVSEASEAEDAAVTVTATNGMTAKAFWSRVLEAMHLQVVSRTTRVWGRKKIYEIYELNGPATQTAPAEQIRLDVETEFGRATGMECRAYAMHGGDGNIYIQLSIGKPFDYYDEKNRSVSGEKKKKQGNEFHIMVQPGSRLMAVSASRAPSRSRFRKFALTAFDLALSTAVKDAAQNVFYVPPARVGDHVGTEPKDLLRDAQAANAGEATGRFATYASKDTQKDPLAELKQVSTDSQVDRSAEQARLAVGQEHGRQVAQQASSVAAGGGQLTATGENGQVVDHDVAVKKDLKRSREENFGEGGPELKRVVFKWTGETSAAAAVWGIEDRPKTNFKCVLTLKGANVFEGLREMLDFGLISTPLPDYLKNAPSIGKSTIIVKDGAIIANNDRIAE